MMGTEDWEEPRTTNHTPTIALGVAGFLLLVMGAFTYREHVRSNLEKEYAAKERDLMMRHGYVPYPAGPQAGYNQVPGGQPGTPGANPQAPVGFQQPTPPLPQAVNPQGSPTDPNRVAAAKAIESSLPEPQDPELDSIRDSLNQSREQSLRTEQEYLAITGDVSKGPKTGGSTLSQEGIGDISEELPEFLRDAVENPPGGNPSVQERVSRVRDQVLREPSIAQVTNYNNEWGIVTFNAGSSQNVKKNQRFAIRRGGDILGWIKVDEVQANQSIGIMVTKNAENDLAIKPDVGDDLINFELF